MAVFDPFRYQLMLTSTKTALIIVFTWIYCFTISYLPSILGYHNWVQDSPCYLAKIFNKYIVLNLIGNFFLATFIIFFFYGALFKIAARHMREIAAMEAESQRQAAANLQRQMKAAKTLLIVIGTFSLCWLPFIINLLYIMLTDPNDPNSPAKKVQSFLSILLFFNSAVNPIIYARKIPGFRTEFIRILTCCRYNKFGENSISPIVGNSFS